MLRAQKGFTLIELMIVVAIIAVLAGMMISLMPNATRRARLNGSTMDVMTQLMAARQQAQARGRDVVVAIVQGANVAQCVGGMADTNCVRYVVFEDTDSTFSNTTVATFDPASPSADGGLKVIEQGTLDRFVAMGLGDLTYTAPAAPYASLPAPDAGGCSFCAVAGRGYVRFTADGTAFVETPASAAGATLFFTTGGQKETRGIAVTMPTGQVTSRLW